jgi:hypothetical protein
MYQFWLKAILFFSVIGQALAQDLGNSPYSQAGIGDLRLSATASQQAFPGSISNYSMPFLINSVNPSQLGRLSKTKSTIFESSAVVQYKRLRQNTNKQNDFGGSLDYLQLAFPVSNRLGACIGLTPYSSANSQNTLTESIINSNFQSDVNYQREGGINNLFLGLGYDFAPIFGVDSVRNRLLLGGKVNYVFGSVIDQTIASIVEGPNQNAAFQANLYRRTSYTDFTFEGGLTYIRRVGKDYKLHLGAVASIGNNLNSKRFTSLNMEVVGNPDVKVYVDTLANNLKGNVSLPTRFMAGFTFERDYKWAFSAEAGWQDWSNFTSFEQKSNFKQSLTIGAGVQWMPDFFSVSKGFWRRTIFRGGVQWQQTPLVVNDQNIRDISLRLGATIPFGRTGGILSLTFAGGQKGTLTNNLVRENYFRANIGITINDRWFLKPKFD